MSDTLTTNEVAGMLDTDAKTLRKFFRSDDCEIEPVGQGSRYHLDEADVDTIKPAFAAWSKGKAKKATDAEATKKPAKGKATSDEFNTGPATAKATPKKRGKKAAAPVEELDDEDLDLDEPAEEDLEELEDALEELDMDDDE